MIFSRIVFAVRGNLHLQYATACLWTGTLHHISHSTQDVLFFLCMYVCMCVCVCVLCVVCVCVCVCVCCVCVLCVWCVCVWCVGCVWRKSACEFVVDAGLYSNGKCNAIPWYLTRIAKSGVKVLIKPLWSCLCCACSLMCLFPVVLFVLCLFPVVLIARSLFPVVLFALWSCFAVWSCLLCACSLHPI